MAESCHRNREAIIRDIDRFIAEDDFAGPIDEFHFAAAECDGADAVLVARFESGDASVAVASSSRLGIPLPCDLDGDVFAIEAVAFATTEAREDKSEFVRFENGAVAAGVLPENKPMFIRNARRILFVGGFGGAEVPLDTDAAGEEQSER